MQECKCRNGEIIRQNKEQEQPDRLDMEIRSGQLCVDGNPLIEEVSPPDPTNIVDMDSEELDGVLTMNIPKGEVLQYKGNTFAAYTKDINSVEEINKAYLNIRLKHPEARHIICAYSIDHQHLHKANNFCDDQDVGMGRALLSIMEDNAITHRVFFVVRHVGPARIGPIHFDLM